MSHLLASYPWSPLFQGLLNGIGWILAKIYDVIPNYGVAIIILTVLIRVVLLPLGIKQIKSMQHMQAIQPRVKEIQKKYKGNKTKQQEETMKLYSEMGVSPFGSCLPLLLQFPILISMYAVIRAPILEPVSVDKTVSAYTVLNNHLPTDSALFGHVIGHDGTNFLAMNLQCSTAQAGTAVELKDKNGDPIQDGKKLTVPGSETQFGTSQPTLDCGSGAAAKAPYFVILALMIGSTFYQQRQMTKASPAGAQSQQQQMIMRIMPAFFGFIGFSFPAGLVVYWTTSNAWQIAQQYALLRAGHIGPDALERRKEEMANRPPKKPGLFGGMMDRAQQERERREGTPGTPRPRPAKGGTGKPARPAPGKTGSGGQKGGGSKGGAGKPTGSSKGGSGTPKRTPGRPRPPAKGAPRPRPKKPGSGGSDDTGS